MNLLCLDLEGVLVPEIWIAFAEVTGIPEFKRTTRDEPDYDKLMQYRIDLLDKHGLKLDSIQKVIGEIDPLPGAVEFIAEVRTFGEVVILSDTFTQFAGPLMAKLNHPALFCNTLTIDETGRVAGYTLRQKDGKRKAIEAFRQMNVRTMAAGDSFNDLGMITNADAGALFRTTPQIREQFPQVPAYTEYSELLAHYKRFCAGE